ncbi:hypothetical protein B0H13DRAFT_1863767 [Mycena leptocephala]|nr:hypothetical protein B0H13DRAFT_1863767 [Mycena leptocephala]
MPSPLTSAETTILGGLDLAISADVFLQGVLCAQFAHYTNVNTRDRLWLKLFVTGLALLTTLKTIQILSGSSSQSVVNALGAKAYPILEALIAVYVQSFFCRRLATISGMIVVILCMIASTFALVSGIVAYGFLHIHKYIFAKVQHMESNLVSIHLGAALCADLLLTGSTAFYLLTRRQQSQSRQRSVAVRTRCFPQLYAWSAMWTLNSREDIHLAAENSRYTLHPELQGTSDSETSDYNNHGRTDKSIMGLRSGQDRVISLGAAQKLPQNSELACAV